MGLENLSVQKMDAQEMKSINGGGFWQDALDGYSDCLNGKLPDFEDRNITYWVFHGLANGLKGAVMK